MKKIKFGIPVFLFWAGYVRACDACKLQQPKITQDLTHGTGPESNWDWCIVVGITVITLITLLYSFRFLIKPGEKNRKHIKNTILDF
ncbi:hypothetical protein [Chryseobacterium paludis]|uniref:hypothetical protein n=1 Tax=Chryseobacterium paludis TaxID=2956784 RepID=UPI0021BE6E94|nr:hypothetical protein [Chryseobacterium paludis]